MWNLTKPNKGIGNVDYGQGKVQENGAAWQGLVPNRKRKQRPAFKLNKRLIAIIYSNRPNHLLDYAFLVSTVHRGSVHFRQHQLYLFGILSSCFPITLCTLLTSKLQRKNITKQKIIQFSSCQTKGTGWEALIVPLDWRKIRMHGRSRYRKDTVYVMIQLAQRRW
jgi:hypothetical protein